MVDPWEDLYYFLSRKKKSMMKNNILIKLNLKSIIIIVLFCAVFSRFLFSSAAVLPFVTIRTLTHNFARNAETFGSSQKNHRHIKSFRS